MNRANDLKTCALLLLVCLPYAAQAAGIEDLLQERWFDIEIIVFERLDLLDVNSSEDLTLTRARSWPRNLIEFGSFLPAADGQEETEFPLATPSPLCLGYPTLLYEDPLHPALLPPEIDPRADLPAEQQANLDEDQDDNLDEGGFANEDPALTQLPPENEPQLTSTPYLQFLADIAAFEADLYADSYRWLDELTLENEVKAINRQSHLRPLIHRRWRQPVPDREHPQPIYLASATDLTSPLTHAGMAKLEGHIAVTVGRYLHVAPKLWYHADNLGLSPVSFPAPEQLPRPDYRLHMELNESRRLRSGDLHYLDHPKFGLIVRIDPVSIPEPMTKAWQALDRPVEDGFQ